MKNNLYMIKLVDSLLHFENEHLEWLNTDLLNDTAYKQHILNIYTALWIHSANMKQHVTM